MKVFLVSFSTEKETVRELPTLELYNNIYF